MVAGVEEIVTIVARYSQIEALYLSRPKTVLKQEFERHLLSLYKHIIRYQISATCYDRRNTMREFSYTVLCRSSISGAINRRKARYDDLRMLLGVVMPIGSPPSTPYLRPLVSLDELSVKEKDEMLLASPESGAKPASQN
jgi:hypothetical protein